MDEYLKVWMLAYVSVLSIRLHPRNAHGDTGVAIAQAGTWAAQAARRAVEDYKTAEAALCRHG